MSATLVLEALEDRVVPSAVQYLSPDKPGLFRNGTWLLDTNNNHLIDPSEPRFVYGLPTDTPVTGDWNGDGRDEVGVFRNFNGAGQWILDSNANQRFDGGDAVFLYGLGSDQPVTGDWNAGGQDKVGVFRNGTWSLDTNGNRVYDRGDAVFNFGLATDKAVTGDWNGDRRDKVGVVGNNGQGVARWTLDQNGNQVFDSGDPVFLFGLATDIVRAGDWNNDSNGDKPAVIRSDAAGNLVWSLDFNPNRAFDPGDQVFPYGVATDKPVSGKW